MIHFSLGELLDGVYFSVGHVLGGYLHDDIFERLLLFEVELLIFSSITIHHMSAIHSIRLLTVHTLERRSRWKSRFISFCAIKPRSPRRGNKNNAITTLLE